MSGQLNAPKPSQRTDKGQPADDELDDILATAIVVIKDDYAGEERWQVMIKRELREVVKHALTAWADTRAREARLDELVNLKQNPDRIAPSDLSVWVDSVIEVVTVEDIDERLAELRTPEQEGTAS